MKLNKTLIVKRASVVPIFLVFILLVTGGISALLSSKDFQIKNNWIPFPLHFPDGIDIDSKGNIYCSIPFYSRLQKYSPEGDFLCSWIIGTSSGKSHIEIDSDDVIHVYATRGEKHYTYDTNGKMLDKESHSLGEYDFNLDNSITDNAGNAYEIRNKFTFPKIIRKSDNFDSIVISTPWFMKILDPLPLLFFTIVGLIVNSRMDKGNEDENLESRCTGPTTS